MHLQPSKSLLLVLQTKISSKCRVSGQRKEAKGTQTILDDDKDNTLQDVFGSDQKIDRTGIPDQGRIMIGDQDISNLSIESLRNRIGIVSQDTFLFNASIRENIRYGNKLCSDEEIVSAAKQSQCDEFISSLKDGYETLIGERGQKLSGGQRQRLAIARAIVRDPDVLIFDEATSSVDNRTERLIQKSFFDLKKNRTMIIVAHRLSTIRNCDNIFVIKDSAVHESGTHDQLMSSSDSFYAELWNIQTGKKI